MEILGARLATHDIQRVRLPGGAIMLLYLREHVQRWIYFFGVYEAPTVRLLLPMLRPGMTVVDIGANVGQYTLIGAARVGPSGRVHAFEPDATNCARLRANVAENRFESVRVNQAALSDRAGTVTLYSPGNDNAGEHSLLQFASDLEGTSVPALTLDEYLGDERVDLIKIDVQGAEELALRGAETVLRRDRPILVCEFEERWLVGMGSSTRQLRAYLEGLGYVAYWPSLRGLKPVGADEEVDGNLFLIHPDRHPSP